MGGDPADNLAVIAALWCEPDDNGRTDKASGRGSEVQHGGASNASLTVIWGAGHRHLQPGCRGLAKLDEVPQWPGRDMMDEIDVLLLVLAPIVAGVCVADWSGWLSGALYVGA
jgi:hypothetical protein